MAEKTPLYMDINNVYSGDEMGLPNRDMISEGIVAAGDMAVTAGAGNTVNIAAGACWVVGDTDVVNQPTYRIINDAVVNLGINPDPTNPRIVRVGMQINDATFTGVLRSGVLTAIHGTPAGSPVAPAEPASFLTLATVLVPAAAASSAAYTFTDLRARARVGGGQALGGGYLAAAQKYVTLIDIVSSNVETDILQAAGYTIPGNLLGASGIVRVTINGDYLNNTGANQTPVVRIYFGSKIWDPTGDLPNFPTSAVRRPFRVAFELSNLTAGTQTLNGYWLTGAAAAINTGLGGQDLLTQAGASGSYVDIGGTSSIDTTTSKVLEVTFQTGSNSAQHELRVRSSLIEFI